MSAENRTDAMSTAPGTRRSLMPRKAMRAFAEALAHDAALPFRVHLRSYMPIFAVSLGGTYVAFKMVYETYSLVIGAVGAWFYSWVAQPLFAGIRKSRREAEAAAGGSERPGAVSHPVAIMGP